MISIVGCDEGSEADAARQLKLAVLKAWPWIEDEPAAAFYLIPNVQCHGETPRDIDLVILASLPPERATFQPTVPLRLLNNMEVEATRVRVRSLCIVLEIKDHTLHNTRFAGTKIEVRYSGEHPSWHSASQQNERQKYSLRNYLQRHLRSLKVPYITNLLWLRNVARDSIPRGADNVLASTVTWSGLLNAVAANTCVWSEASGVTLASVSPDAGFAMKEAVDLLGRQLAPTRLDRCRMDRIACAEVRDDWIGSLGRKQLILQGRGGTGKTVILLGLAWRLQEQHAARVLILTYNRALVADLRRLLTLMGLGDDPGQPFIEVQSVHSFFLRLLSALGLLGVDEDSFLERYGELKQELLGLLRAEALSTHDIDALRENEPEYFAWDHIFVDEAQDWPEDERDLLHRLYPSRSFVIADGRDQLVRQDAHCDWTRGPKRIPSQRVSLNRGLRMKANLARFANALARELGLTTWSIEANLDGGGGRVIIAEGDYRRARRFHTAIIQDARQAGNACVDILMCVPPSMVVRDDERSRTELAEALAEWGQPTWNGVSEDLRRSYPTSIEQLRIVQYDSCRGLEGWTVINLGVDDFFEYKRTSWSPPAQANAMADGGRLAAQRFATRWLMIPCTRAIDTLVLHVRDGQSPVAQALRIVASQCSDFVECTQIEGDE